MSWLRRQRMKRLREKVRDLNFFLNSIDPKVWPDEYDDYWNERVRALRSLNKLEAREAR
jgi:hypothetical protein